MRLKLHQSNNLSQSMIMKSLKEEYTEQMTNLSTSKSKNKVKDMSELRVTNKIESLENRLDTSVQYYLCIFLCYVIARMPIFASFFYAAIFAIAFTYEYTTSFIIISLNQQTYSVISISLYSNYEFALQCTTSTVILKITKYLVAPLSIVQL